MSDTVSTVHDDSDTGAKPLHKPPMATPSSPARSATQLRDNGLSASVATLRGVGDALAKKLERLGIRSVRDLLFHLPLRYEDRTRLTPIGASRPGSTVVIEGKIALADLTFGRRRSLLVRITDNTGAISMRLYHFSRQQQAQLAQGACIRCYGEVRAGATGAELYHPEYRVFTDTPPPLADRLTPIYPITEGVGQRRMRDLTAQALALAGPEDLRDELLSALELLHAPKPDVSLASLEAGRHPAQQCLAADELLAHHLSLVYVRRQIRARQANALPGDNRLRNAFLASLPFTPTSAQMRTIVEIDADLATTAPTMRLVHGDVGSGKTLVAAAAALRAAEHNYQAALMAPTELLAEQHARTLADWFDPLGVGTALCTGHLPAAEQRRQKALIANGEAKVVIGTHALFQSGIKFHNLALVIIDEQHRFGVHQRLALSEKGISQTDAGQRRNAPHQIVMTATPIPRTLAMSAYADLDLSMLDELPKGRMPIKTVVVDSVRRDEVIKHVADACQAGRQAYWVCTMIEASEELEAEAAEDTATLLTEKLTGLSVGLVHGRMKNQEKAHVMGAFIAGELDLLVATTVIEVGVDVPNASLMVIEDANRLGLAQLHQLRGRVGRSTVESHCVLMYRAPLSQVSRERLKVMRESSDGFVIAEMDLALRGPGEILGTKQTGLVDLRVADLARDRDLLPRVQTEARRLMEEDPAEAARTVERWFGNREHYAEA